MQRLHCEAMEAVLSAAAVALEKEAGQLFCWAAKLAALRAARRSRRRLGLNITRILLVEALACSSLAARGRQLVRAEEVK